MQIVSGDEPYDRVIPTILSQGSDFEDSDDFRRLIGNAEDLPGVVACAYARWVSARMRADPDADAHDLFRPLNILAALKDEKVDTMLGDEVLEEFESQGMLDRIAQWMGDDFLGIKDSWVPIACRS